MSTQSHISQDDIQQRAYQLWLVRGCPMWDSHSDWEAAEIELRAEAARSNPQQESAQLFSRLLRQVRSFVRPGRRAA